MDRSLRISATALQAFQRSIAVHQNNIANAATDGFSRQRPELAALPFSSGVKVEDIARFSDAALIQRARQTGSEANQAATLLAEWKGWEAEMQTGQGGFLPQLQALRSAFQDLQLEPNSDARKQIVIAGVNSQQNAFKEAYQYLEQSTENAKQKLAVIANEVQSRLSAMANIQKQMQSAYGDPSQIHALKDQRDRLLQEISARIEIQTKEGPGNSLTVLSGSGQLLLENTKPANVKWNGSSMTINDAATSNRGWGGQVGGLLQWIGEDVPGQKLKLEQTWREWGASLQTIQDRGIDSNGQPGSVWATQQPAGTWPPVLITSLTPNQIAANAPWRVQANGPFAVQLTPGPNASNGNASVGTAVFENSTTYRLNNGPPQTYDPANPPTLNGWQWRVTPAPVPGTTLTFTPYVPGQADGQALTVNPSTLSLGLNTASTWQNQTGAYVGQFAQTAATSSDLAQLARQQERQENGVNVEEELIATREMEQAYQAAAQMFSASQRMFDSLIRAVGG